MIGAELTRDFSDGRRKLMNGFLQSVWQLHDRSRTHVHCMAWAVSSNASPCCTACV